MNITKFVSTNIYLIMTLFICAISYIYVVNGLKCHIVLGVCSIGIEGIVSYSVYVVLLSVCKEGKTRHKPLKRKPINPKNTGKKPKPIIGLKNVMFRLYKRLISKKMIGRRLSLYAKNT